MRSGKLWAGHGGITTRRGTVGLLFFKVEEDELSAHALDLLGHFGTHVERVCDRTKGCGRSNRGQSGNASSHDQNLRWRNFTRRGDLTCEEAWEVVSGFNNSAVACDVRHRGKRVHLLSAADTWHHFHGNHVRACLLRRVHTFVVGRRREEGNQGLTFAHALELSRFGLAHFRDDVRLFPKRGGGLYDLNTCFFIKRV